MDRNMRVGAQFGLQLRCDRRFAFAKHDAISRTCVMRGKQRRARIALQRAVRIERLHDVEIGRDRLRRSGGGVAPGDTVEIGRASGRGRGWQSVMSWVVRGSLKKTTKKKIL